MDKITSKTIDESEINKEFLQFTTEINNQFKQTEYGYLLLLVNSLNLENGKIYEQTSIIAEKIRTMTLVKALSAMIKSKFTVWDKLRLIWELI